MTGLPISLSIALAAAALLGSAPPADAPSAPRHERGLWFGPIQLCRDTVETASVSADGYSGAPLMTVTLKPDIQPRLGEETARRVGRTMPIHLDGRLITEPHVREPITGTGLQLMGVPEDAEAIRAAALGPC